MAPSAEFSQLLIDVADVKQDSALAAAVSPNEQIHQSDDASASTAALNK